MSLKDRILKNTKNKMASGLDESVMFTGKDRTKTGLPILNIAFSGSPKGGFGSGLVQFAGESKCFKTNLALLCIAAYLKKHKEGVCVFYDSEHGTTPEYMRSFGIDTSRIVHVPVGDVETLKIELIGQLDKIERGEKVVFLIDSIGNLASRKELQDALDEKTVTDMSRAKSIKSLWRIVTPLLTERDVTCFAINHTYKTQELYSKDVVSGGTGNMYSANTIFIITRAQEKDAEGLKGWKFTINIEKSRDIKEKSKLPFVACYDDGIDPFSGLLDLALDFGLVVKPKVGWYTRPCVTDDKNWRAADTSSGEFWKPIFENTNFEECIEGKFKMGSNVSADFHFSEVENLI